jgi:hypothetical protein
MLASGLFATVMLVLANSNGVVLTADSAPAVLTTETGKQPIDAVSTVGSRVVVAGEGFVHWDAKAADGSMVASYDFKNLIADVSAKLQRNPKPAAVAEAVRDALAKVVAHVGNTTKTGPLPNIVLVIAGLEGKQPAVWTVRAHLESPVRPVIVDKERNFPGKANPYLGAYGMKRTVAQVTADWRARAPDRLKRDYPPLQFEELAEMAGFMVKTEQRSKPPIRQWVVAPGEKLQSKLWQEPH